MWKRIEHRDARAEILNEMQTLCSVVWPAGANGFARSQGVAPER
jgi:hypothetical protein